MTAPESFSVLLPNGEWRVYPGDNKLADFAAELTRQRDALAARVRSLEEALQPFAEAAEHFPPKGWWPERPEVGWDDDQGADDFVTVGDLRAARAALSDTPREEWDPSGFDIKHDPNEPLPSYHWDFEDTREEGSE